MSTLLVYPYSRESCELVRYVDMTQFERIIPVSPLSFGIDGDANMVDGGPRTHVNVESDYEASLKRADAVLFVKSFPEIPRTDYEVKISSALSVGKKVYTVREVLGEKSTEFQEIEIIDEKHQCEEKFIGGDEIYEIPVPVIVVLGAGAFCDKFQLQLSLRQFFLEQGYKVSQWGSKSISTVFGFEMLPDFLFENGDSLQKIVSLNHLVYSKVIKKHADVVLIGVPGGIMQCNPYRYTEVGEMAYLISNAIKSDICLLSIYANTFSNQFIDELRQLCRYRYDYKIFGFNVASSTYTLSEFFEDEVVRNSIASVTGESCELFTVYEEKGRENMFNQILEKLQNNI